MAMTNLIAVLCSFLAQFTFSTPFSPQNAWILSIPQPQEIEVHFASEPQLAIGSPVIHQGQLVGSVRRITPNTDDSYEVTLALAALEVRKGSMALVSSAWLSSDKQPETYVELMSPEEDGQAQEVEGEPISGFSSFEEFWRADGTMSWIDA